MPRLPLVLLVLLPLPLVTPASAQTSDPFFGTAAVTVDVTGRAAHPDPGLVVARLLSFDANDDGTIAADELPERMQLLLARGDADANGVIDEREARALVGKPFPRATSRGALLSSGTYGFVDDVTLSSRSHVEGAIDDLRLPAAVRTEALAIASRVMDGHEEAARVALIDALTDVLPAAQLALLGTAIDRALQPAVVTAPEPALPADLGTAGRIRVVSVQGVRQLTQVRTDLNRVVALHSLTPEQRAAADAALKQFKDDLRVDDQARDALIAAMKDVLGPQSREDLRAALGRRPVAPTGAHLLFSTVSRGGERTGQVVLVPLVHRMER